MIKMNENEILINSYKTGFDEFGQKMPAPLTHDIVHAGFNGCRKYVTCKKSV